MARLVLITGIILCLVFVIGCDQGAVTEPTLEEQLQATLAAQRESNNLMGISAAVIMPNRSTWLGVSGVSEPGGPQPIRSDMLFGIGSITKTYTAVLVLQLIEEGLVDLDDPLHRWLQAYPHIDSTITIRHLLNHTSGIHNYTDNPALFEAVQAEPTRQFLPEEMLAYVGEPDFAPGSHWRYSNTNYILLGMVIESVASKTIEVALQDRLLNPLNLRDTYLGGEVNTAGTLAHNWSGFLNGGGSLEDLSVFPKQALYSAAWTAGALISTAEETAQFAAALYGGAVLNQATMEDMLTFYPFSDAPWTGYGLGVQRMEALGKTLWGHGGNIPGYTAFVLYDPAQEVAIAVLINQDGDDVGFTVATELLRVVSEMQG